MIKQKYIIIYINSIYNFVNKKIFPLFKISISHFTSEERASTNGKSSLGIFTLVLSII